MFPEDSQNHESQHETSSRSPAGRFGEESPFGTGATECDLDTELSIMGLSARDDADFLQRVNARIAVNSSATTTPDLETDTSFFGLSRTLYSPTEPSRRVHEPEPIVQPKAESTTRRTLIALAVGVAAMIMIQFGFWHWGSTSDTDSRSVTVANTANKSIPKSESVVDPTLKKEPGSSALTTTNPPPVIANTTSPELDTAPPAVAQKVPLWHLRFEFDAKNRATAWLNKKKLMHRIPAKVTLLAIRDIGHSVAKHVHFYSPILSTPWTGQISVTGPDFEVDQEFEGVDEMHAAWLKLLDALAVHTRTMNATNQFQTLPSLQKTSRHPAEMLDQLANSVIAETDALLHSKFEPTRYNSTVSVRYKNYAQLDRADLSFSKRRRKWTIPAPPAASLINFEEFETQPAAKLKKDLESATEFSLFDDYDEFRHWIDEIAFNTKAGEIESQLQDVNETQNKLRADSRDASTSAERTRILATLKTLTKKRRLLERRKKTADKTPKGPAIEPLVSLVARKPALSGFSLIMGDDCHLCEADAKTLGTVSLAAGGLLSNFDTFASRQLEAAREFRSNQIKQAVKSIPYLKNSDQAVGTLDQMLQIERKEVRLELVKVLGQMGSETSCKLLACYAKYDVEADVRTAAIDALRSFSPEQCRDELLSGFIYPWPVVSVNSAAALVCLNDKDAVPALVKLLKNSDPRAPRRLENGTYVQKEMVAINHLRNCMLCHEDSIDVRDPGRGLIPYWNREMSREYYKTRRLELPTVRADITYLRQDFSVNRKVENPGPWPENQRFDYVVRQKTLTPKQADALSHQINSQRNYSRRSIVKALRLLTGLTPGDDSYTTWNNLVGPSKQTW